jgi:hypothetical protein
MTTTTIDFTIKDLDGAVVPLTSFQIASGRLNTGEIPDVMPATVTFTTDSAGQASVTLTVTEAPYYLSKLDGSTDQIISYKFFVPTTSSTSLSAELLYVDLSRRSLQWNDKSVAALIEAKIVALNAANQALLAVSVLGSVSTLSTNLANIIAVGTNIASVNTAAGAVTNIATVAGVASSISTISPYAANIATVAGVVTDVAAVAGSIAAVSAVAPYVANIATVAPIAADVSTVAGISTSVSSVAGNTTNINTVAANTAVVATVSTNIASVNTVATNMADVQAAVGIVTDIAAIIPYVANISTVATNITPIVAVGNNIDNINDVQDLEEEIVVLAANISNLTNAAAAVTQAVDAQKDLYTAGTDYTQNTSTSLTLTYFPAKSNSVKVFFGGVYQNSNTWSRVGKTIVFNSAISSSSVEITYEVPSSYVGLSPADTAVITAAEASATNSAANALQWSIDAALYASNALATATQAVDGIKELFLAGSHYVQNVGTVINLGYTPAKINTVKVFMDGVYQNSNTYSLSGTVLTFSSAIISDTVEIQYEVPSQFVGLSVADQATLDAATAAAQASANAAALSFDSFDDRYLGAKTVAPTVDNDGSALITGAMYFDSTINKMYVRTALSAWASMSIGDTTAATVGAAGAASALPANPVGYVVVSIGGTTYKIPYYNM